MDRVLLLLLPPVVLVLLALSPGGVPAPTLAQDCPNADVVVKERQKQLITEIHDDERGALFDKDDYKTLFLDLYVKPQPGFEGMDFNFTAGGKNYTAWFPVEPECFSISDKWYEMRLSVMYPRNPSSTDVTFHVGGCRRMCNMTKPPDSLQRISAVAYGPSLWLLNEPPFPCGYMQRTFSFQHSIRPCRNPPLPTTSLPASEVPTVVLIMATTVAVVVLLVVAAMLFRRRRQHQQSATSGTFVDLPKLESVILENNMLSYLHNLTFDIVSSEDYPGSINLKDNNITVVEVDAFKGVQDFSNIYMDNNALTSLPERVWRPLLEREIKGTFKGNPLTCGCDVAWLVRNPQLLTGAKEAQCADGKYLTDLDPADFNMCD